MPEVPADCGELDGQADRPAMLRTAAKAVVALCLLAVAAIAVYGPTPIISHH